ncbi:MAG: CsgG/HfaB family protein, partial [bacterium]
SRGFVVTAGFTVRYQGLALDYAASVPFGGGLGLSHLVGLGWETGPTRGGASTESSAESGRPARSAAEAAAVKLPESRRLNVAVMDLSSLNVSSGDSAVISDMIRGELIQADVFNVIEKSNMEKILAEQAFQQTGCTSVECAVKVGKLLNVQRMVVGSFGKLLDEYVLNVRMIDIETGRSLLAEKARVARSSDMDKAVSTVVRQLIKGAR